MIPGDIVDTSGNIFIQEMPPPFRRMTKLAHGRAWVSPDQAVAAKEYGWRVVSSSDTPESPDLVAVERTPGEASSVARDAMMRAVAAPHSPPKRR